MPSRKRRTPNSYSSEANLTRSLTMLTNTMIAVTCVALTTRAFAQAQKLTADIASLPEDIKSLKWQNIDPATLTPLEQARSLLLMDHVLSELSANTTAEADLLSSYIEMQNLRAD